MARERKLYPGGLVRSVGIPSVSFAQYNEMASAANTMQKKLDTIVNFATKKEEQVQIQEAKTYAASNPISADEYLNASPAEREKILGGNKSTSYGQTVRATQLTFLSTEMAIKAQKDFAALKIEANTTNMPLDEYENKLNAIVQGYSDAVLDVDAEAAITVKSDLATKANTYYSSYSDKIIKDYTNLNGSLTIDYGNEILNTIPDELSKGHIITVIGQDGQAKQIPIDEHLKAIKQKYALQLLSKNMKKEDFKKWSADWDARVIQDKKNIIYGEFIDKPDNLKTATRVNNISKEVMNGNFNGNKKLQALYNSLDEKEQKDFKDTVRDWKNKSIQAFEDEEKGFEIDLKAKKDDLEIKYLEAVRGRDYTTANAIVEEAKGIDDGLYKELLEDITKDVEDGDFLDPNALSSLEDYLFSGTLTMEDINVAYKYKQIDINQKRDLKSKLLTRKNEAYRSAEKYMRRSFGFPEAGMITLDKDTKIAFQQFRTAANDLMDYMDANPNATEKEIMAEAKKVSKDINTDRDIKAEIKTIKSTIINKKGEYGLSSRSWENYFKKFYKPDFTNINDEFLNTTGGISLLITELEELKELENGKKYKVNEEMITSEGGFFDDKFVRPMDITNQKINSLIEELEALSKLYE